MWFLEELKSVVGFGAKRKEQDQQPLESPAKRSRQVPKVEHQLDPPQVSQKQPVPAHDAEQMAGHVVAQQQQRPLLQQPPVQHRQQPERHNLAEKVFLRHGEHRNNAFKQLEGNRRSSATPLAGAASHSRARYFSGQGPHIMRQQLGSSTPVVGWKSNTTPQHGLHSQPRLHGIANSRRYQEQQPPQQHQQQPAKGGAAAAVFGELAIGDVPTPDLKQRLFEAPDAAPVAAAAAAALTRQANHRAEPVRTSTNTAARMSAPNPPGRFTQLLQRTAPGVGVAMNGPVSSIPGASTPGDNLAPMLISPAAAAASRSPAAVAPVPAVLSSPSAGFAFATVSALQMQDRSQLEQEIAQLQQEFARSRQQEQSYHHDIGFLQSRIGKALGLSPGYQASTDPGSKAAMRELLQQGQQKQQQRLQREADLVQQRGLRSPQAAAVASPVQQQLARQIEAAAAAPAAPAAKQKQQRQAAAAADDNDDVICLTSSDEEDDQQQEQQEESAEGEQEHSSEYDDEVEEGSEAGGSAEESEEEAAAAAVEGLHLQDVWMGRRSNWTPTEQQLARFESATEGPGPLSELLTSHARACIELRREHMGCLRPRDWLNDEVINMYMALLQDRDTALRSMPGVGAPRCHFFNTFFMNKLYKDAEVYNYANVRRWSTKKRLEIAGQKSECLLDIDRIIVPVHEGVHWTAAMVDLANKRFVFFDSLLGRNPWALKSLKQWLADEAMDKRKEVWDTASWPALFPQDIPRQQNGCDCGVFALLFCNRLGLRQPFDFVQADLLLNARVRVCCELLDGRLPVPGKHQHHH